jgi:AMP-binding enzyme
LEFLPERGGDRRDHDETNAQSDPEVVSPSDRMYNCLPMYHRVGGAVATGAPLVNGGSVVVRNKFSASAFWDDIRRYDCTMFQYIGELCRYPLNASPPLGFHGSGSAVATACGPTFGSFLRDVFAFHRFWSFMPPPKATFLRFPASSTPVSTASPSPAPTAVPAWRRSSAPGDLDVAALREHLVGRLSRHALPVLLRIRSEIDLTPTFKQKKNARRKASGIHRSAPMRSVPLDLAIYERIRTRKVRF